MAKLKYIKKSTKKNAIDSVKERSNAIIDIYKQGGGVVEVEEYLRSIKVPEASIRNDIWRANLQIKEEAKSEREVLIQTHVKRYEKLFKEHISKTLDDFSHIPVHLRKFMLVDCYIIAMDALVAKEKVLGLHTKRFRVQLNTFFKKKVVQQYNFKQQDFKDLVRLKELLAKMKAEETPLINQVEDIVNDDKEKIVDIDHILINDQVSSKIVEEVKVVAINKNDKSLLENIQEKIYNEDLKKVDVKRASLLEKLKNLNK